MNVSRLALALFLGAALAAPAAADDAPQAVKWYEVKNGKVLVNLYVFHSRTCPHCATARTFLDGLQKRHDWLVVTAYETSGNPAHMDLYRRMASSVGKQAGQVPAFFYCKQLEIGYLGDDSTGKRLEPVMNLGRRSLWPVP
jgi:ribosomal protein S27AE